CFPAVKNTPKCTEREIRDYCNNITGKSRNPGMAKYPEEIDFVHTACHPDNATATFQFESCQERQKLCISHRTIKDRLGQ
ncbi:hypothetical protein ANCDUO_11485, partial [Ancylostoma duodenale]